MTDKQPRTRWSPDELEKLFGQALHYLAGGEEFLWRAVDRAQAAVLPENRRRRLFNIGGVPPALRARLEQARRPARLELIKEVLESNRPEERAPEPAKATLVDLAAAALASLLSRPEVVAAVRALLADAPAEPAKQAAPRHDPEPSGERRARVPTLLVVGVKPDQRDRLAEVAGGKVTLKWWLDESLQLLRAQARTADCVLLMLGATSHAATEAVRAENESTKVFTSVRRIQEYLEARP